ncbi:hypothetical protein [uncultured Clostridium sp.]|uniref:hypothetical protein n=1 Tax=uncultured Clostridium sp. TaxID=59620 RepID=UPI002604F274|nr:hypothetical protein [uncultured Clostridium sp.]
MIRSCAGCKALVKESGRGSPLYFRCDLNNEQIDLPEIKEVYDRRLDSYVNVKPVLKCKCRTLTEMVNYSINKQNGN